MDNKPVNELAVLKRAVALIEDFLGSQTAKQYEKFYADKTQAQIIASITELLNETVGPTKATKLISENFAFTKK